jgi:hypothetical protein
VFQGCSEIRGLGNAQSAARQLHAGPADARMDTDYLPQSTKRNGFDANFTNWRITIRDRGHSYFGHPTCGRLGKAIRVNAVLYF